eukprot:COSAG05_NODE_9508_length_619_cov_0.990385_1_plen_44_part_10
MPYGNGPGVIHVYADRDEAQTSCIVRGPKFDTTWLIELARVVAV